MLRSKLGLLSLCALALGLMAFASSASAAPEWLILDKSGTVLTTTELSATVVGALEENMGTLLTHLSGLAVSVLCMSATLEGTKLDKEGKLTEEGGKVTFEGCTVPTPSGCEVKSKGAVVGTIASLELKGTLESSGEIKIEPKTAGGTFTELIFSGATCPLPTEAVFKIGGVLWLKDCEGKLKEHLESHLIVESTAHGKTLFIGADTAEHLETSLDGSTWVRLSDEHTGLKWGATLPEWLILNTKGEVKTATELNATVVAEFENEMGTLLTHLVGLVMSVKCASATLTGTKLEGNGKLTEGSKVTFTGCTIPTPSTGCAVKSKGAAVGTITSVELKGTLESSGETKISRKASESFVELIFSGATCTLPTEVVFKIGGVLWLKDCEGKLKEHVEKHLIVESTAHGKTLFIGADTAEHLETSLDGSTWVRLSGEHAGLKWGAMFP
jgi:hypothetical protein